MEFILYRYFVAMVIGAAFFAGFDYLNGKKVTVSSPLTGAALGAVIVTLKIVFGF